MMLPLAIAFLICASIANAGPRASTNYAVSADTADSGGQRTTSTNYTHDGSITEIADISTTPTATVKHSYIGQLTDVTTLELTSSPGSVEEGSSRQFSASLLHDDLTTTPLLATAVTWGVHSGPLTGVDSLGLATASVVYQHTAASVQGTYASFSAIGALTVLNVNTDDLPGYSGDGMDDAWQVQYFGLNNPLALPTADPDSDGQNNAFEYIAGVIPTDATSRFLSTIESVPGQPLHKNIIFSPRLPDRTYTVKTSTSLGPSALWSTLTGFTSTEVGDTGIITDTNATGSWKFYIVEITRP